MRLYRVVCLLAMRVIIESRRAVGYLVMTLAVVVAAWFVLAAIAAPGSARSSGTGTSIFVQNGSQSIPVLPLRYARRLVSVRGAQGVSWTTVQMVQCGAESTIVTLNALGGAGAERKLTSDMQLDATVLRRWLADPLGVIISSRTARDCGWTVGQGIDAATPSGTVLELHVSGIFDDVHAVGDIGIAHFAYINRVGSMIGKDQVVNYTVFAANSRDAELVAARIEQEFANDFPTVSAFTNTTVQNALARFGKVQQLVVLVMVAILLCAASVLISVLAHSAAQRRRSFALLQVLGFRKGVLFAAFALQAVLILVIGAALGIGVGIWIHHLLVSSEIGFTIVGKTHGFIIPGWAYLWLPVWLGLLLVASLGWPALLINHVRPTDHTVA